MITEELKKILLELRVAELKTINSKLSLPATGKKADLQTRIFNYLGQSFFGQPLQLEPVREEWKRQAAREIIMKVHAEWKDRRYGPARLAPAEGAAGPSSRHSAPLQNGFADMPNGTAHGRNAASQYQQGYNPQGGPVETITAGENITRDVSTPGRAPVNGRLAAASPMRSPKSAGGVIRCVCENNVERDVMVQCEATGCGVWQHCACVGISGTPPEHFYCEQCRACWADPYWEVKNAKVMPVSRLVPSGGPVFRGAGGTSDIEQVAERTFQLTHPQVDLLKKSAMYQLQAVSLLLGDPVPFRFQWPRNAELKVNQMGYRVYSRQASSKIGNNVRDEPANLATTTFAGQNRIRLKVNDSRKLVLMVQLVRRREDSEVKALMAAPESLSAALQRVKQQVNKGDDDISMGSTIMSLRDPLSGSRVVNPARFQGTNGLVAFDLETFLGMAKRTRKWQCPHSMRHTRVQELQPDTFVSHILQSLKNHPEIVEIEVSPEGQWRPSTGNYPWTDIAAPLPDPLPEEMKIKPEPDFQGGHQPDVDSDEEELSEAEELRRAAAAYASVAKRPSQEVIVLDDSSDEDFRRPTKRPAVASPAAAEDRNSNPTQKSSWPKPLHQQTLQSNLRAYHMANRSSSSPAFLRQQNPGSSSFPFGEADVGRSSQAQGRNGHGNPNTNGAASEGVQNALRNALNVASKDWERPRATQATQSSHPQGNGLHAQARQASSPRHQLPGTSMAQYPANESYSYPMSGGAAASSGRSASGQMPAHSTGWKPSAAAQHLYTSASQPVTCRPWQSGQQSGLYTSLPMPSAGNHNHVRPYQQAEALHESPLRSPSNGSTFPPLPPAPPPPRQHSSDFGNFLHGQELDSSDQALLDVFLEPGRGHYTGLMHSSGRSSHGADARRSLDVIDLDSD